MLALCPVCRGQQPAFPGAEGFGRFTVGGRGGAVYHVTNLDDDGEGSLRWACGKSGRRTIVFDVDGTIQLRSELKLRNGHVTLAGQTAPGDGVCVAGYPFVIGASDVVIRYMRFRVGDEHVADHEGDGLGGMDGSDIVVDHCSVSWSVDECLSVYGSKNITVQWCLASQSMVHSGHSKGAHGYGGNWGGSGASYHHNLLCHHTSRVPRLGPRAGTQTDERMDMRNNVFYNYNGEGCYGGEGMHVNIVNNLYKPGPANKWNAQKKPRVAKIGIRTTDYTKHGTGSPNDWDKMWHVWGTFYVQGNQNTECPNMDEWQNGVLDQISNKDCDNTFTAEVAAAMHLTEPIAFPSTTTHTAAEAYERVLSYAGASLHRDALDETMVNDTRDNTATYTGHTYSCGDSKDKTIVHAQCTPTDKWRPSGFINSQNDLRPSNAGDEWSAWPALSAGTAPADGDGDGMPDDYETAHGLDPNDPADGAATTSDGYTNLEHYINGLVADITENQNKGGVSEGYTGTSAPSALRPALAGCEGAGGGSVDLLGRPAKGGGKQLTIGNRRLGW